MVYMCLDGVSGGCHENHTSRKNSDGATRDSARPGRDRTGRIDGDRWVLDRRAIRETLGELAAERALLMKVMDKGGVAVAEDNDTVITVFNLEQEYQRG
jgi:hypothetical protein